MEESEMERHDSNSTYIFWDGIRSESYEMAIDDYESRDVTLSDVPNFDTTPYVFINSDLIALKKHFDGQCKSFLMFNSMKIYPNRQFFSQFRTSNITFQVSEVQTNSDYIQVKIEDLNNKGRYEIDVRYLTFLQKRKRSENN